MGKELQMNRTFELLEEGQEYAQQILNYTSRMMDSLRRHPSEWATVFEVRTYFVLFAKHAQILNDSFLFFFF